VQPGDQVAGRYRLEALQGHGPMSEVWRAHDETLDRRVALKMLSPTADLERFRREARSLAGLAHENVMRVFDYGEDAAGPYMALEWLPGGTLEDRLAGGAPLPPEEAGRIANGLAAGLAHLHSRGLVHRDLKPANVLFDEEERPKLGDFGLVRHAVGSGTLTEAGTLLGTAAYISPEQAAGAPAGPASDVYSFGVILFRMLTGSLPFAADNALALLDLHRHEPPPSVEQLNPEAPAPLAALAAASLRKDPAARPPDGAGLLAGLATPPLAPDIEQTLVAPRAVPAAPAAPRRSRLRPAVALAVLVLAAAGALVAWAVARPASTARTDTSLGSVARTKRNGSPGSTRSSLPLTGTTRTRSTRTQSTTTRGRTTTARTTTPTTTQVTTTAPVTTTPTTAPTTTATQSTTTTTTTAPTTSSTVTTTGTTTSAGTTTTG
jgi:serine/threonine-protein kinase